MKAGVVRVADRGLSRRLMSSSSSNPINWYPGHISSGEKKIISTLPNLDVVLEVRDARCLLATSHPDVHFWGSGVSRIIIVSRVDCVDDEIVASWMKAGVEAVNARDGARYLEQQQRDDTGGKKKKKKSKKGHLKMSDQERAYYKQINQMNVQLDHSSTYKIIFSDLKSGQKISKIKQSIMALSSTVNSKRVSKGLLPRALRVGVVGYPNTGKSSLINRLLGRRRVKSEDRPGVTRALHWVKVSSNRDIAVDKAVATGQYSANREFEILDTPGIIPKALVDQDEAMMLAACNIVGSKGYDVVTVAGFLIERIRLMVNTESARGGMVGDYTCSGITEFFSKRYSIDIKGGDWSSGQDVVEQVAHEKCSSDAFTAANMVLNDFRSGRMGKVALQCEELEGIRIKEMEINEKNMENNVRLRNDAGINLKQAIKDAEGIELPDLEDKQDGFEGW